MAVNGTRRNKRDQTELLGHRIREAREHLNITQEALGKLIGRTQYAISQYEAGNRAIVITDLPLLADALQVPLSYFFENINPDLDVLELASELKDLPSEQKKMVVDRWRTELEWWKKHSLEITVQSI